MNKKESQRMSDSIQQLEYANLLFKVGYKEMARKELLQGLAMVMGYNIEIIKKP